MVRVRQQASGSYTLTFEPLDDDGAAIATAGTYTCTVRDGAGTSVHTGTPTVAGGVLSIAVPVTSMARLDTYTVTWGYTVSAVATSSLTLVELVGGHLFEVRELRTRDRAFADVGRYPAAMLEAKRVEVEDTLESQRAAAVAFVPRGRRVTLDGHDRSALCLPDVEVRQVYSVTVDGVAWTSGEVAALIIDDAWLHRPNAAVWPAGVRNIVIHYAHGRDAAPAPIVRAALTLAREYLAGSDLPGRATATSIGDQMFRLTVAGRDGVTGLPEVDAAIEQHGRKRYRVG